MNVSAFISYRDNNASINKGQSSPKMPNQSAGKNYGNLRCKSFCKSLHIELNGGEGGRVGISFLWLDDNISHWTWNFDERRGGKCNLTAFVSLL
jgi:hypothetical protein